MAGGIPGATGAIGLKRTIFGSGRYRMGKQRKRMTRRRKTRGRGNYQTNSLINGSAGIHSGVPLTSSITDTDSSIIADTEHILNVIPKEKDKLHHLIDIRINPGLGELGARLRQKATMYSEYEMIQCIISYTPEIDNFLTTNGQTAQILMMNIEPGTETDVKTSFEILHDTGASKGKITQSLFQGVECDPNKNSGSKTKIVRCFMLKPGDNIGDYDYGTVRVFLQNVPLELIGRSVGRLSVSYKVLFHKERLFNSVGRNLLMFHFIGGVTEKDVPSYKLNGPVNAGAVPAENDILNKYQKLNQKSTFVPVVKDFFIEDANAAAYVNATIGVVYQGQLGPGTFVSPYPYTAGPGVVHSLLGYPFQWAPGYIARVITMKFPMHVQGVFEVTVDYCYEIGKFPPTSVGLRGGIEFVTGWARNNESYNGDHEVRGREAISDMTNEQVMMKFRVGITEQNSIEPEIIFNVGEISPDILAGFGRSTNRQIDIKIRQLNDLDRVSPDNGRPFMLNNTQTEIVSVV